jgi:hypothetical protein
MPAVGVDEIFRVGGFMFSRTSVATLVGGVPYTGITEVNVEESREGELQYGQRTDGTPLGITSGLYTPGAFTFKAYVDTGTQIEQQLALLGLGSFGSVLFPFILEIFENPLLPTLTIQVNNVKIEKRKFALPTDTSALMYEYECKFLGMQTIGAGIGLTGVPSILANYAGVTNGI